MLAFVAGQFDMTFPYEVTASNMKDIKSQMPNAVCEITPTNFAPNLLMTQEEIHIAHGDRTYTLIVGLQPDR
jgi:peptide/nickel transport system substrate-binding protein